MDPKELGWLVAHRLVLAHLVRTVRMAVPEEAHPETVQATQTMLQQSLPAILVSLPPAIAVQVEEAAADKVQRILRSGLHDLDR